MFGFQNKYGINSTYSTIFVHFGWLYENFGTEQKKIMYKALN